MTSREGFLQPRTLAPHITARVRWRPYLQTRCDKFEYTAYKQTRVLSELERHYNAQVHLSQPRYGTMGAVLNCRSPGFL